MHDLVLEVISGITAGLSIFNSFWQLYLKCFVIGPKGLGEGYFLMEKLINQTVVVLPDYVFLFETYVQWQQVEYYWVNMKVRTGDCSIHFSWVIFLKIQNSMKE